MHIKKAYMKKGVGGHFEEIVKGLLPKDTGYVKMKHDVSNDEHPMHMHPSNEMLHVLEGTIHFTIENVTMLLKAGDHIFLPKHLVYSYQAGPGGCSYVIEILKD